MTEPCKHSFEAPDVYCVFCGKIEHRDYHKAAIRLKAWAVNLRTIYRYEFRKHIRANDDLSRRLRVAEEELMRLRKVKKLKRKGF